MDKKIAANVTLFNIGDEVDHNDCRAYGRLVQKIIYGLYQRVGNNITHIEREDTVRITNDIPYNTARIKAICVKSHSDMRVEIAVEDIGPLTIVNIYDTFIDLSAQVFKSPLKDLLDIVVEAVNRLDEYYEFSSISKRDPFRNDKKLIDIIHGNSCDENNFVEIPKEDIENAIFQKLNTI
jgi:hypothetical protein